MHKRYPVKVRSAELAGAHKETGSTGLQIQIAVYQMSDSTYEIEVRTLTAPNTQAREIVGCPIREFTTRVPNWLSAEYALRDILCHGMGLKEEQFRNVLTKLQSVQGAPDVKGWRLPNKPILYNQ
ncbi:hypothetical protein CWRG_02371 [Chthonomonas calidirosea]|uniref:hypothetical protein n=1 Tax=Chthonomonas calidirosea TaxID=454171 RepID=UPI0006DD4F3E|nr:hypothetical protein [Chthonomonas calidirosea]CEK19042.1 hypothetical protein CWRG_02371 [Chthonomonas calidirosea]